MTFVISPPDEFTVHVITDDTTTEATIVHKSGGRSYVIARGVAKRRAGDKRDHLVGSGLALQRAFREALKVLDAEVERLGYGPANDS